MTDKKNKGVNEWVDHSYNIQKGCTNNCTYCYAHNIARRFDWCPSEGWDKPIFNEKAFNQSVSTYYPRGVMFPTSHDITKDNIDKCIAFVLRILRESKNNVLIVTKPKLECVSKMCHAFKDYHERVEFRFTITSLNQALLNEWEPNAPTYRERLDCLMYVALAQFHHDAGIKPSPIKYKVSVSMEPFLDKDPMFLIIILYSLCDSIWLGAMSNHKYKYHTKENLLQIMDNINKSPDIIKNKIHYKNSFRDVMC